MQHIVATCTGGGLDGWKRVLKSVYVVSSWVLCSSGPFCFSFFLLSRVNVPTWLGWRWGGVSVVCSRDLTRKNRTGGGVEGTWSRSRRALLEKCGSRDEAYEVCQGTSNPANKQKLPHAAHIAGK